MDDASSSTGTHQNPFSDLTTCASPSTTLWQQQFDVFINHRGPDAKRQLASPIRYVLELNGVKAFLDQDEVDLGGFIPQVLEDAIRGALMHIAIFSKDYVRSPWCLSELWYMLKTGAPIITVFYDVQPIEIRRGLNTEAFSKHETRYSEETLKRWGDALEQASHLTGSVFKSNTDDLGLLLKYIVNRVGQERKSAKVTFKADKDPVGLQSAVRDINSIIDAARAPVQIVGIVGMGGCGKTTLARLLYDQKFTAYDRCSFVPGVSEASLPELQKKLLWDLLRVRDTPISNKIEGRRILFGRLRSASPRALIVLDDVDHVDQLNYLLPENGETLGSDSLIIVTTRYPRVLTKWNTASVYKMPTLNPQHAKQLLCRHAFKAANPPAAFEGLSQEIISACNRLPLSLKVIGEALYGKTEEIWRSYLEKISRLLPSEINEMLKPSYEALDNEEKKIFLDLCCFFIGEEKSLALAVCDAADRFSLESLEEKYLFEVDSENRITMHNHLRDLGREFAADCLLQRLWSPSQIITLRGCTQEIRGMVAVATQIDTFSARDEFPICSCTYRRYEDIKFLVVAGDYVTSAFNGLAINLVWLRWSDFQQAKLPSWVSFKNLRVLEIDGVKELFPWKNNSPKELKQLTITVKQGSNFKTFPSEIGDLKHLTKIVLNFYGAECQFNKLPNEFCGLKSLEHVELRNCQWLSSLPDQFGDLRNLNHLYLCSCENLMELPNSFKQLTNLQNLDLYGCKKLTLMPDIFEKMEKLGKLNFTGCTKLQELPLQITEQKSLTQLRLKNTNLTSFPNNIDQLCKLEMLVIGSPQLTGFSESLGGLSSLTRLKIVRCMQLKYLPESLEHLKHLEHLVIKACGSMSTLPEGLRRLSNLHSLKIIDCPIAQLDFSLGSSSSLDKLKMMHLKAINVRRLSISKNACPNLETLQLEQNSFLTEMDIFSESVKTVKVHVCRMLQNINHIPGRSFNIIGCPSLHLQPTVKDTPEDI